MGTTVSGTLFVLDFDGTVTLGDAVDELLSRFADASWRAVEDDWVSGKIDARTCLALQARLIRARPEAIQAFWDAIPVDPDVGTLIAAARRLGRVIIASDGFEEPIRRVLARTGIAGVPIFANRLLWDQAGAHVVFPHQRPDCRGGCGVCKCAMARTDAADRVVVIGDGRSDRCLAESADEVFAKGSLRQFCAERGIPHTPFYTLADVARELSRRRVAEPTLYTETRHAQNR